MEEKWGGETGRVAGGTGGVSGVSNGMKEKIEKGERSNTVKCNTPQ